MKCERVHREGWVEILKFLPYRSVFSIEARFKRLYTKQTAKNASALKKSAAVGCPDSKLNKYEHRKRIIRKIASEWKKKENGEAVKLSQ